MEVAEDADIEQLLALRNALMNQLNQTQPTSTNSKHNTNFSANIHNNSNTSSRRSSITKYHGLCPIAQPPAISPSTSVPAPPPPSAPCHSKTSNPKKRSKKCKIRASQPLGYQNGSELLLDSNDDIASSSSSEIKSKTDIDYNHPSIDQPIMHSQQPSSDFNQLHKTIPKNSNEYSNQCEEKQHDDADITATSIDEHNHIVNKQSYTFLESAQQTFVTQNRSTISEKTDDPPGPGKCPFLPSNSTTSISPYFVKTEHLNNSNTNNGDNNSNNIDINEDNATLNVDDSSIKLESQTNCDNGNDIELNHKKKTGCINNDNNINRKRVQCDDDDNGNDNVTDKNMKIRKLCETEPLIEAPNGTSANDGINTPEDTVSQQQQQQLMSSSKEYGNETAAANEDEGAIVLVEEDGLLPPPPPPPEINISLDENGGDEAPSRCVHEIIPPPPKPPVRNDLIVSEQPSTSYLQNNDEQNAEGDNDETNESVKETTFEEPPISDDECEENIDSLLEKPYKDGDKPGKIPIPEEGQMREKIVLAHRGVDYFDVLPEGWVELTHTSGLPVYLHKASRVCTFSRPYFIGPSSVRHHHVPESAIPCLHQRRVLKDLDESAKLSADALQNALNFNNNNSNDNDNGDNNKSDNKNKNSQLNEENAKLIATLQAPNTKVQTAEDFKAKQLEPKALHEYAKRVFKFKTIQVYRFQKWSATRTFHRQKKLAEAERLGKLAPSIEVPIGRPTLPGNVQLITVPAMEANLKPQHKGFFLNPQGKTSISILHEYVQKVLKSTINYQFTETRSSSTPYGCAARLKMNLNNRVMSAASIKEKLMLLQEKQRREAKLQQDGDSNDSEFVVLGNGCGNSKKSAKLDAAKSALKVLIPAIDFDTDGIAISHKKEGEEAENEQEDAIALFDMLSIEDSRIPDLSLRAGQPSPYLLLQECLKRNAAYGDTEIKLSSERVRHQKHQFDMDVGKHRVSVECSNKREGKQKASQAMLKKLHPNLDTWGSLIRLYGNEAQQKQQEAKRSQRSIIKLQGNRDKEGSSMEPNQAILERLRAGMLNIENDKKKRKEMLINNNNNNNEQRTEVPLIIRPKLSQTNASLNSDEAARESSQYAATHPDALSAFRIDL